LQSAGIHKDIWFSGNEYEHYSQFIQKKNAAVLARLHKSSQRLNTIFELGCGTGNLTEEILLSCETNHIDALDISNDMISIAKSKSALNSVKFFCTPFLDFIPTIKYSAIFSNAAFHWLYPMYLESLIKMESMLLDNGLVYIATAGENLNSLAFDAWIDERLHNAFASHEYQPFASRRLDIAQFESMVASTPFILQDAFILERWAKIKISHYVEWFISSGALWNINEHEVPELKKFLICRLSESGDGQEYISMGHWSLFAILKK